MDLVCADGGQEPSDFSTNTRTRSQQPSPQDLGRERTEAWLGDIVSSRGEAEFARKHLGRWMKRKKQRVPVSQLPQLPFGGVGDSGMGAYHGEWGFQALSHRKAVC